MTKDEALKRALEALQFALHVGFDESSESQIKKGDKAGQQHRQAITSIKQALAAPVQEPVAWMFEFPDKRVRPKFDSAPHGGNWQPLYTNLPTTSMQQPDAYGYARRLADAIWKKHYKSTAPQWEPFDNLIGVLTQIDNMTSGLTTPPAAPAQEPVAWATAVGSYAHISWGKDRPDYPIRYKVPLYTTPPAAQRQWVGLTNAELLEAYGWSGPCEIDFIAAAARTELLGGLRKVEAKLKEKNI